MRGVSGTSYKSTEPAARLHDLNALARQHPEVLEVRTAREQEIGSLLERIAPDFATGFAANVTEFGHRTLGQDLSDPTIAETPSLLLSMIADRIATGHPPDLTKQANRATRESRVAQARERLAADPDGSRQFERVLSRALRAFPVREDNEFYTFGAPFALLRYAVLELGTRLTSRGVVEEPEDVLFLHLDEARRALTHSEKLGGRVAHRKGQRLWATQNPGPPSYGHGSPHPSSVGFPPRSSRLPMGSMLWSLEAIEAVGSSRLVQSDAARITGTPASSGIYTGPVRIVRDESEFGKLQAGDVLVCPITSPVWSVLFPSIGALVTDTGGILSHPAIIAREYRIPAVVATGNSTGLLSDGLTVTIDGTAGLVTAGPA